MTNVFSEEKPEVLDYIEKLEKNNHIDPELFDKYKVNRGLRDLNGNGVLTGLTEISEIMSFIMDGDQDQLRWPALLQGY